MNIFDKLEEIRQKPEHIRTRYAWFMVAASMTIVLIVWVMSIVASEKSFNESADNNNAVSDKVEDIKQVKGQVDNVTSGISGTVGQIKEQVERQSQNQQQ